MMSDQPHACQLAADATTTIVPVCAKRTVCYQFDTSATNPDLELPYTVIVDGTVLSPDKPRRLNKASRKISVIVSAGSSVALYLNSDVHPAHRRTPVYAVDVKEHDVLVNITEKTGKTHNAKPVVGEAQTQAPNQPGSPPVDRYEALLTGDIWMAISHRYTEAEANDLLPDDMEPAIRKAVCGIYRGLSAGKLDIPLMDEGGMLCVSLIKQENPHNNITSCSFLSDVLPRTHPLTFAALFSVARKAGITELHITSCWRPSLGSIVHRAGLGLDVDFLTNTQQKVKINRAGLNDKGPSHNPNVSDKEKALHQQHQEKKAMARQHKKDPGATQASDIARVAWEKELQANEPSLMQQMRESLAKHKLVRQILDPWYIALQPGSRHSNEQQSGEEKIHANHLHITVREPKIYE
ncbi:hypothetical protein GTP58_14185 [Duganella sp. CY15W]|uniref:hypothetical protein n=1 Tax=Duganella sp. CY15W TaxID=2692172 RepID=UPI0013684C0F|nr:hypothetical protein [Duganella sp. CY15W]MYM29476.1 hypothetical protein [Duganella sp. CY15W]